MADMEQLFISLQGSLSKFVQVMRAFYVTTRRSLETQLFQKKPPSLGKKTWPTFLITINADIE